MALFFGIFRKTQDGYSVDFPELPGLASAGKDLADALDQASEGLALHLHGMAEDGDQPGPPMTVAEILMNPEFEAEGHTLLPVAPKPGFMDSRPAVRVNFSIAADLLDQVDAYAKVKGESRSSLIAKGLQAVMGR